MFYCIARCLRKRFVVRSLSLSVSSYHFKSEKSGDSFAASKRRTVWAEVAKARNTVWIHGTRTLPLARQGSAERFDVFAGSPQSFVAPFLNGNGGISFCFLLRDAGF
jgi:hypothetical protein